MMLLACRGLSYNNFKYFDEYSQGPSLNSFLEQGLLCDDDLELLIAFDGSLLLQFDQMDGRTGLFPLLTAATQSHSTLDFLYKLTAKCPVVVDHTNSLGY